MEEKNTAKDTMADLSEKIAQIKNSEDLKVLKEVASDLAEDTAEFVKKYPLHSVLGALAVGFVLGTFVGRRR